MAGVYTSSIGDQLGKAERGIRAYIRRMLLEFGRRFRARMMRERIGGGAGSALKVKTGKLKKSFRYKLVEAENGLRIEAEIGGGGAGYAEEHEERQRLEFQNTFEDEVRKILDEIQTGLEFFSRNPVGDGGGSVDVEADLGGGDPVRASLFGELRAHHEAKKAAAKLRRASKWRSMRKGA